MGQLTDEDKKWVDENEQQMIEGREIVDRAVEDALEYLSDTLENLGDRQWRKMTMGSQPLEMGIGQALADNLIPHVYQKMQKEMHKKLKIKKKTAEVLRHIFIGRVIKNIRKELHARDQ